MARFALVLCLTLGAFGCTSSDQGDPAPDGGSDECAVGTVPLPDDSCLSAGVTECAEGFVLADSGCTAVLPDAPCAPGTMAIVGETACRPVAPCGDGTWGAIPVDGATIYVDGSFTGASNGSAAAPFTTIQDGVDAAPSAGLIAIAAGQYEGASIQGKSVRLWGRCPELVTIAGAPSSCALALRTGASGSEAHDLGFTSPATAICVTGAEQVLLSRLWIHGGSERAVSAFDDEGPTSAVLRDSLIETMTITGVQASGADVTIDSSVLRDGAPAAIQGIGSGAVVLPGDHTARGRLTVRATVIDRPPWIGIYAMGSDLAIEGTLIRDVIEVVTDTGRGVEAISDFDTGASTALTVRQSVIEGATNAGIFVYGSTLDAEQLVVRDTIRGAVPDFGRGLQVANDAPNGVRSTAAVRASLFERNTVAGICSAGSDITVDGTVVRDTIAIPDGVAGHGVHVQASAVNQAVATGAFHAVLLERNEGFGAVAADGIATLDRCAVVDTLPHPIETFGDGITSYGYSQPTSVTVTTTHVSASARAGMSSFGATMIVGSSDLKCNTIHINGEHFQGTNFTFEDRGDNACSCDGSSAPCKVMSAGLVPPSAL